MDEVQVEAGGVGGGGGGGVPVDAGGGGRSFRPLLTLAVSIAAACLVVGLAWVARDWLRAALVWVQSQPSWSVCAIFALLFCVVSFPVAVGYLVLLVSAGYLLGVWALPLVVASANLGVLVSHAVLRRVGAAPLRRLLRSDSARALFRVISGPHSFRIVVFARLSPVPFGVQNTIFALSNVGGVRYHGATMLGLLPAQIINVYLGSTLRSMHDVFQESHITGYIMFACQITIGITLMVWVVQKSRKELTFALLEANLDREGGLSTSSSSASLMS